MMIPAASLLALVAYVAAQADPSINTAAAVVQCQPVQISYVATNGPVFFSILPGGQASAAPIQSLGVKTTSPFTWVANIASGTPITFQLRDSAGAVAYSALIIIQDSADAGCLGVQDPTTAAGTAVPAPSITSTPATSVVASVSSAASASLASVSASIYSIFASLTLRPTNSFPASATAAMNGPDPIPSGLPFNAASPNTKIGLAGLLALAATIVVA